MSGTRILELPVAAAVSLADTVIVETASETARTTVADLRAVPVPALEAGAAGAGTVRLEVGAADTLGRCVLQDAGAVSRGVIGRGDANHNTVEFWSDPGWRYEFSGERDPTVRGHTIVHAGNDGAGSGWDADTVDGWHASDLAVTAATGYAMIASTVDWNDVVRSGFYNAASAANQTPHKSSPWQYTLAVAHNGTHQWQLASDLVSSRLSCRHQVGGVWGAWKQIWTEDQQGPDTGMNADTVDGLHASDFALAPSDARLKQRVTDIPDALIDWCLRLRPVTYELTSAPGEMRAGYVVQEMAAAAPPVDYAGLSRRTDGYLAWRPDDHIAVLHAALNRAIARIDALERHLCASARSA